MANGKRKNKGIDRIWNDDWIENRLRVGDLGIFLTEDSERGVKQKLSHIVQLQKKKIGEVNPKKKYKSIEVVKD